MAKQFRIGDAVIKNTETGRGAIGVIETSWGQEFQVKLPEKENRRETWARLDSRHVAEIIAKTLREGGRKWRSLDIQGGSALGDLLRTFGQPYMRIHEANLNTVQGQLRRYGLKLVVGERRRYDDQFSLALGEGISEDKPIEPADSDAPTQAALNPISFEIPDPFWPIALGLPRQQEMAFLRALADPTPLLCVLQLDPETGKSIRPVWEGLIAWARSAAQNFVYQEGSFTKDSYIRGEEAALRTLLRGYQIESGQMGLDEFNCALITLRGGTFSDSEIARVKAIWPGSVFEFTPGGFQSAEKIALFRLFAAIGGAPELEPAEDLTQFDPLKMLNWSRDNSYRLLASSWERLGSMARRISEKGKRRVSFRGSSEGGVALALKILIENWLLRLNPEDKVEFEARSSDGEDEEMRIDISSTCGGAFEVESLRSSGPFESFFVEKALVRANKRKKAWSLVLPAESLLWAGPILADLATALQSGEQYPRRILMPCIDQFFFLKGSLEIREFSVDHPRAEDFMESTPAAEGSTPADLEITLKDVAGYKSLRCFIENQILYLEKNREVLQNSRTSGYLFFGPPGCGKTRLAQALAGEVGSREFRVLGPSDLEGQYVGTGLALIREQFQWLMEEPKRVIFIDELDAIGRSRSQNRGNMHVDQMANVNELLVRVDQALRKKCLVMAATNFVESLDEALIRTGRMGTFIPVPPPEFEDAVAIMQYYLAPTRQASTPVVPVPSDDDIKSALAGEWSREDRSRFASSDLEDAVNRARMLAHREGVPLGVAHLKEGLKGTRRSIDSESLVRFQGDIMKYGSSNMRIEFESATWWRTDIAPMDAAE